MNTYATDWWVDPYDIEGQFGPLVDPLVFLDAVHALGTRIAEYDDALGEAANRGDGRDDEAEGRITAAATTDLLRLLLGDLENLDTEDQQRYLDRLLTTATHPGRSVVDDAKSVVVAVNAVCAVRSYLGTQPSTGHGFAPLTGDADDAPLMVSWCNWDGDFIDVVRAERVSGAQVALDVVQAVAYGEDRRGDHDWPFDGVRHVTLAASPAVVVTYDSHGRRDPDGSPRGGEQSLARGGAR